MTRHEPCDKDEIFVGNTDFTNDLSAYREAGITMIRLGHVAYDIDGQVLPFTYRPIFVHRSQSALYDEFKMAQFKRIRGY